MMVLLAAVIAWIAPAMSSAGECPSSETVSKAFSQIFKREAKVIKVQGSVIPGLCEVDMVVNNRKGILYIDTKGKFFVAGQIMDIEKGKNLTQEAMQELNRMSADDMKKLDSLTAFTAGKSGKTLYYVTDPQCPYCKKGEEVLKKLIDEGKITVKFLFFPLAMHQGADKQCVSIICDNKGLEGLEKGYKSDNQCEEGKKKVQDTIAFLKEKGITGTPVYIFPDGSYRPGMLPEDALLKTLGIEQEKPAPADAGDTKQKDQQAPKQEKQ